MPGHNSRWTKTRVNRKPCNCTSNDSQAAITENRNNILNNTEHDCSVQTDCPLSRLCPIQNPNFEVRASRSILRKEAPTKTRKLLNHAANHYIASYTPIFPASWHDLTFDTVSGNLRKVAGLGSKLPQTRFILRGRVWIHQRHLLPNRGWAFF